MTYSMENLRLNAADVAHSLHPRRICGTLKRVALRQHRQLDHNVWNWLWFVPFCALLAILTIALLVWMANHDAMFMGHRVDWMLKFLGIVLAASTVGIWFGLYVTQLIYWCVRKIWGKWVAWRISRNPDTQEPDVELQARPARRKPFVRFAPENPEPEEALLDGDEFAEGILQAGERY